MKLTYKLRMSEYINEDLQRHSKYMSIHGKKKFIEELNIKFKNIKVMPLMYERLYYDKKRNIDYRRLLCKNYIVLYKIYKNQITILRIVSQKEDYSNSQYFKSILNQITTFN